MSHYAKIQDGIVSQVIVADESFINSWAVGDPSQWVQTSYNSNFRNMYAGIGFLYDKELDIFYPPKPYESWKLIPDTIKKLDPVSMDITTSSVMFNWRPPVKMPEDGFSYAWNEDVRAWKEIILPTSGSVLPTSGSV